MSAVASFATRMKKRKALTEIRSEAAFVLFCEKEGIVSGHARAAAAMRALSAHLKANPESGCSIYERTRSEWTLVL